MDTVEFNAVCERIRIAAQPMVRNPVEENLRIENEILRAEIRRLKEANKPSPYRWVRLKLPPSLALVLDILWESQRPVPASQIMAKINIVRAQQKKTPMRTEKQIGVAILRLRRTLEERAKMLPIRVVNGQGYYILPAFRELLSKWML